MALGSSNLTQTQMLEVIAVLVNNISVPFPKIEGSGLHIGSGNSIAIKDNAYCQNLASQLTANVNNDNTIHISLVEGQPASGQ